MSILLLAASLIFPTNGVPCTNCPLSSANVLTNDPFLHFVGDRLVEHSADFQLNTWQWYAAPNTNQIHVYDENGVLLPAYDEPNGEVHHDIYGLWGQSPHASNQVLAVIDSGQHGRLCASVAGSPAGDGTNMAGIARGVQLRRYETAAYGEQQVTAQIQQAVADGASVVSMSFGYTGAVKPTNVLHAMRAASNVVFVLAALNQVGDQANARDWLCNEGLSNALCVTAIAKGGELFGHYGDVVAVAAAGRRVPADDAEYGVFIAAPSLVTVEKNFGEPRTVYSTSGTSLATPKVAAVCAHLRELYPSETAVQICERIRVGSEGVGSAWSTYGVRNLNAFRSAIWARHPRLSINRQHVYVSVPESHIVSVQSSAEVTGPWSVLASNVTGDGFPQVVASVGGSNRFFTLSEQ